MVVSPDPLPGQTPAQAPDGASAPADDALGYLIDTLEPLALIALRAGVPSAALRLLEARLALQAAQNAAPGDAA